MVITKVISPPQYRPPYLRERMHGRATLMDQLVALVDAQAEASSLFSSCAADFRAGGGQALRIPTDGHALRLALTWS